MTPEQHNELVYRVIVWIAIAGLVASGISVFLKGHGG